MAVTISGMFGSNKSYFADSPVIIDISGLQWPASSPFNVVRVEVIHGEAVAGEFYADTGGQPSFSFDISSALRTIWAEYLFDNEVAAANAALSGSTARSYSRSMMQYSLKVYTEYMAGDDGGVFTKTAFGPFAGGQCLIGGLTEWERSKITDDSHRDVSHLEGTNVRNGDASTKPSSTPERVGQDSITSWVDVSAAGTVSTFYPSPAVHDTPGITGADDGVGDHSPIVLRDNLPYVDFLFKNRRGAIETCSALVNESMSIESESKSYGRVELPSFKPNRSLMAVGSDGRRSWPMSSGFVDREWAEWWTMEFLGGKYRKWWMLYDGAYVPVVVEPAKKSTSIYDRTKQNMPSVEFTVTLALEG